MGILKLQILLIIRAYLNVRNSHGCHFSDSGASFSCKRSFSHDAHVKFDKLEN